MGVIRATVMEFAADGDGIAKEVVERVLGSSSSFRCLHRCHCYRNDDESFRVRLHESALHV